MPIQVKSFFHPDSSTFSYVVHDPASGQAALIDAVLDYDPDTDATSETPLRPLLEHVQANGLEVQWLLETHAHADHVSAGRRLKRQFPRARLGIGDGIGAVQATFAPRYALDLPLARNPFDHLFADGEAFALGELRGRVIAVPGHTSDSIAYLIDDALFPGDSLFMPDGGTARCDFPGGDAALLYRSIQRLLALPEDTRVFVCHDYGPGGRDIANETTIGAQRAHNIHVHDGVDEAAFVAMRQARDATLPEPKLMQAAVKANIQGGA
ncbi:MBL fold metallo-hydrolase [Stenotrophomonas tumulicola]|uniref:MBL fold metallo-hydrolase n=1 Tax=Stenotrophomonas tumulicola TaxID=1685415 RepID=A0A7W3IIS9_9GAMM|nr:MBL fold metallo-hydrolase [Stenotrophomonas tumulicola]MBA8683420.1 MBL fold metallo-hydrolase [Stenotrophomonas tumulicola]